jgi:hypothetical protein
MRVGHYHIWSCMNPDAPQVIHAFSDTLSIVDRIWEQGYGDLLCEINTADMPYPVVGKSDTLLETDRLVLFTLHPEDDRILGLQWHHLTLPCGLVYIAFTRYPIGVDPSKFRDKSGLWFPIKYREPGYSMEEADGGPARIYAAIVPIAAEQHVRQYPTTIKIFGGRTIPDAEIEDLKQRLWNYESHFSTLTYTDHGEYPFYPFIGENNIVYVHSINRLVQQGTDFLCFAAEHAPLPNEPHKPEEGQEVLHRNVNFVSTRMGFEIFNDFDPAKADRVLARISHDEDLTRRYNAALDWVKKTLPNTVYFASPKAHHAFERDPLGDLCGTFLHMIYTLPPEVKLANLPFDIAVELIESARRATILKESVILNERLGIKADDSSETLDELLGDMEGLTDALSS